MSASWAAFYRADAAAMRAQAETYRLQVAAVRLNPMHDEAARLENVSFYEGLVRDYEDMAAGQEKEARETEFELQCAAQEKQP